MTEVNQEETKRLLLTNIDIYKRLVGNTRVRFEQAKILRRAK